MARYLWHKQRALSVDTASPGSFRVQLPAGLLPADIRAVKAWPAHVHFAWAEPAGWRAWPFPVAQS